ncbi:hypothetical protein ONZ45_g13397 [Pleurotus djamor]|nr:hypothetical protein ONZ45_g13397 [Pleurotus djamor]
MFGFPPFASPIFRQAMNVSQPTSGVVVTQNPTPPDSPSQPHMKPVTLPTISNVTLTTVSTSFPPDQLRDVVLPSLILLSSDSVQFHVHHHVLQAASDNGFRGLLGNSGHGTSLQALHRISAPTIAIKPVPMNSATLNVVLHTAYGTPTIHTPSLDTLIDAVDLLPKYGISPETCIFSSSESSPYASPLYNLLLSMARTHPLPMYALAAHHSLEDLAVASSKHLLSTPLHSISDQAAIRMGPIYLKRLSFLQLGRAAAFKDLVAAPPNPHSPTPLCGDAEQFRLRRGWTLAAGSLLWDAQAGKFWFSPFPKQPMINGLPVARHID